MSNITLDEMLPLVTREAAARRGTLLTIFVVISMLFLAAAFLWQKKYTSHVRLYADDSKTIELSTIIKGALDEDQVKVAREELLSDNILDQIVDQVGYGTAGMSAIARERVKEEIIKGTQVSNIDNQLLEIVYEHPDPSMAFKTASLFADLFLERTKKASSLEAEETVDFYSDQVEAYRTRLEDAEARLESFRQKYPGVSETTDGNVNQRIVELRRQMEEANLLYAEYDQRRRSLERELRTESSTIAVEYEASQTRNQINAIQAEIDVLRLSYTDDYPDIVRLKQQMQDVIRSAEQQRVSANSNAGGTSTFSINGRNYSGAANLSPVYQQLRSDLARSTAEADQQRSRAQQLKVMLEKEINRSAVSGRVERELAELNRDYTINKEYYEKLLREQEGARLNMSLRREKQGLLYSIQQEANFPVLPTGLRFVHIAAMGLVLSILLPFMYLIVFLKLDPRIRTTSAITDVLELPLLTTVPHMKQKGEKRSFFSRPSVVVGIIVLVVVLYIIVALLKYVLSTASQGGTVA